MSKKDSSIDRAGASRTDAATDDDDKEEEEEEDQWL